MSCTARPRRLDCFNRIGIALALAAALPGCTTDDVNPPGVTRVYPEKPVEIVVDGMGISHVYAQGDADAFFGAGYAMARDRLFHMELVRRRALGRSAEIFGDAALSGDVGARAFGFEALGVADLARVRQERPDDAALVDAWAAGVNRRIQEIAAGEAPRPYGLRETELDFIPEPWAPEHAFAVAKVLAFGLSNTFEPELLATALLRLVPDTVATLPLMMPARDVFTMGGTAPPGAKPAGPFAGAPPGPPAPPAMDAAWSFRPIGDRLASNNWAVSGDRTDNGRPLLAGDPHQALTSPTRLWPLHMSSVEGGGTLDAIGFSFVGTPAVQLGHNAAVAWSATTAFGDAMDLWDVQPSPDFTEVSLGGEVHPIETRQETIRVRAAGAAVGTGDDVVIDVRTVPGFGVILPDQMLPVPRAFIADGYLLFNWTGFSPSVESAAYVGIDRAQSLDEFERAADLLAVGAINLVAADKNGIDYYVSARVPDRGDPAAGPMPWRTLNGDDAGTFWTRGDLPPSKLPRWRDPARGYIVTANNDPFGFSADGNVENDPFYYGAFYANGFRAGRIQDSLDALIQGGKIARADMEELQRDVQWGLADTLVPALEEAIAAIGSDPDLAAYQGRTDLVALAGQLSAWDRRLTREQAAPVVFTGLSWFAAKRAFEAAFTPSLFDTIQGFKPEFFMGILSNTVADRFAAAGTYTGGNVRVLLLAALDDTASWLTARFGAVDADFTMADVHVAEFPSDYGGELEVEPVSVDGGDDTVNVSPAPFFDAGEAREQFGSRQASLYRMVVGFAEDGTPEATVNFARGTSEDPASPHFADRQESWVAAAYTPLPFRRADVDAQVTDRVVIEPK